ncbi:MAG: MerR family transcriptional regulator [Chloroflexota bacterium]|nr:MerR family transcriptional regulator [Chloroflexota bacterium]
MSDAHRKPVFSLKSVVRETGVKPDTLRAWERRYGLPQPARTKGGHRLYSQRDIEIIKWLLDRQRENLRIKGAVELWRSLEAEGREPLQARPTSAVSVAPEMAGQTIADLCQVWVAACLAFDERQAEQVLTQAFALYPPEVVCLDILREGIAQIGQGWYEGQVTVQQEHFSLALAIRRVETLRVAVPPATRPGRILLACPPEEGHSFGLLLLTYLLRRRGWEVLYLGANVPLARLEEVVRTTRPSLTISMALQLPTAATLLEMALFLRREGVPLAFGGWIFDRLPALRTRIPGHFLGPSLELAAQSVEDLLVTPSPAPAVELPPESHRQALSHYREHQWLIEADLIKLRPDLLQQTWSLGANRGLTRHIAAALALGDINFMDDSIDWVAGMGRNGHSPAEALESYLGAYLQAAKTHLDERGAPIIEWLSGRIDVGN